jgi:hypothetical protein
MSQPAPAWSQQLSKEARQQLIHNIYDELKELSGETDATAVWTSAAKFEMKTLTNSKSQEEYLQKVNKKIASLRKKRGAPPVVPSTTLQPNAQQHHYLLQQQQEAQRQQREQQEMQLRQQERQKQELLRKRQEEQFKLQEQLRLQVQQRHQHPQHHQPQPQQPQQQPQNSSSPHNPMRISTPDAMPVSSPGHVAEADQYWHQHARLKQKYARDLAELYTEFKKVAAKPGTPERQKLKLKNFLDQLKKVLLILSEDRAKGNKMRSIGSMKKLEQHIIDNFLKISKSLGDRRDRRSRGKSPHGNSGTPIVTPHPHGGMGIGSPAIKCDPNQLYESNSTKRSLDSFVMFANSDDCAKKLRALGPVLSKFVEDEFGFGFGFAAA